jgi:hypothetical protein
MLNTNVMHDVTMRNIYLKRGVGEKRSACPKGYLMNGVLGEEGAR